MGNVEYQCEVNQGPQAELPFERAGAKQGLQEYKTPRKKEDQFTVPAEVAAAPYPPAKPVEELTAKPEAKHHQMQSVQQARTTNRMGHCGRKGCKVGGPK